MSEVDENNWVKYYIARPMNDDNNYPELMWWKHRSNGGYTTNLSQAGVYSERDADFHCGKNEAYTKYRTEEINILAHESVYKVRVCNG